MRHKIKGRKFGRTSAHRKSMLMNLAKSLFLHDRIQTTLAKAKDLRPYVEKIVTLAKGAETLAVQRRLISIFRGDMPVVERILSVVSKRVASRPGGYCRIMKNGFRKGDNSPVALIEFVDADILAKNIQQKKSKEQDAVTTSQQTATTQQEPQQ